MNPEINHLIQFYSEEKENMESQIKLCILESDYLLAHFHLKYLKRVNHKLETLNNLNDSSYEEKRSLKYQIQYFEKELGATVNEVMKNYFQERLELLKSKIAKLNQLTERATLIKDDIDNALYDLIEGKINNFKLHLNKERNLYLEFNIYQKNTLQITLPQIDTVTQNFLLNGKKIKSLKGLGFKHVREKGYLLYEYDLNNLFDPGFLKTLLARIIFDLYYYKEFDNQSFLEYN